MVSDRYVQKVLERMRVRLEVRGLKPVTVAVYLRLLARFVAHVGKPLGAVEASDVEGYLHELARRGRAPQSRNVILASLRLAFRTLLRRDPTAGIPQAKVPRYMPAILSGSEVRRLLEATTSLKYRAIFMLLYGAGLRVSEAISLETGDINSERMLIHVREGKTGARYVMMSPRLLATLRAYWRQFRPTGPRLFPGQGTEVADPHLTRKAVHKVLAKVVRAAGIGKRVSAHTLRHSFATHLLDAGADVRTVQVLLGRAHIESTTTYLHLTTARLRKVPSPLDLIATEPERLLG